MRKYNLVITAVNRITDGNYRTKHKNGHAPNNYLSTTVRALMEKGGVKYLPENFMKVTIYESGSKDLSYLDFVKQQYPNISIVTSDKKLTLVENTNRALLDGARDAEYTILVQDDVIFAVNAILKMDEWVDTMSKLPFAFLTLWNCAGKAPRNLNYVEIAPNGFWGNLFLIFRSHTVDAIINAPQMRKRGSGHDMALKGCAAHLKKKIYANSEGLIEHIGHFSSLGQRSIRRARHFVKDTDEQSAAVYRNSRISKIHAKYGKGGVPPVRDGKISVGIAITTWNDIEYTEAALQSALKHTPDTHRYTFYFYVLDDASPDVDVNKMVNKYKENEVRYHKNDKNKGLTNLWNRAYEMAKADNCKYLVLSNNDVLYSPQWCERILNTMEDLWSFKAAGPLSNAPGHVGAQYIKSIYADAKLTDNEKDIAQISEKIKANRHQKVQKVNGFCMIFKMDWMSTKLHPQGVPFNPDPKYKIYGAEDEYFERAKPKTIIIGNSYVFHYKQVTTEKHSQGRSNFKCQWVRKK